MPSLKYKFNIMTFLLGLLTTATVHATGETRIGVNLLDGFKRNYININCENSHCNFDARLDYKGESFITGGFKNINQECVFNLKEKSFACDNKSNEAELYLRRPSDGAFTSGHFMASLTNDNVKVEITSPYVPGLTYTFQRFFGCVYAIPENYGQLFNADGSVDLVAPSGKIQPACAK